METKGKEEEDDPYSLEVGEKYLRVPSQSESTLLLQDKGKVFLVEFLHPQFGGITRILATKKTTFKHDLQKIQELLVDAFLHSW